MHVIQMGNDLTNFLIAFFADAYVLQDFIFKGALFHALIPSLMDVFSDSSEKILINCVLLL